MSTCFPRLRSILLATALLAAVPAVADERSEVEALTQQMMTLYNAGHYDEAAPLAVQILNRFEKTFGNDSPAIASSLNNLAEIYVKQKRYADAEPLLKRSLALREKSLGSNNPDTAKSRERLAALYQLEGRTADAPAAKAPPTPAAPKRIAGTSPPPPAKEPDEAAQTNQQINKLTSEGRYADALPLAQKLLPMAEKLYGPDNRSVAVALSSIGQLQNLLGKPEQAEPTLTRALGIMEKAAGPEAPELAVYLDLLADSHRLQRHFADAETLYKRGLAIRSKTLDPAHPDPKLLEGLTTLYRAEARDAEAERSYENDMGKLARSIDSGGGAASAAAGPSPFDRERAQTLDNKVYELEGQGHYAEALPVATELQTLLQKMWGGYNIAVAMNLDNLATIYKNLGRATDAAVATGCSQAIRDAARNTSSKAVSK